MKTFALITAFVSGFITLSLEILGFRALAPYFGYSTYAFGSLIGLVLFAFAVGYWFGGIFSKRGLRPAGFFSVLLAAGIYLIVMSAFYEVILQNFSSLSVLRGTLVSTFVLWAFPMAAFAAVSPYLVGMRAEKEHAGHSAGLISAVGTLGSLAGTFMTSFYLLPAFGTHATFAGNAYAALILPLVWLLILGKRWSLPASMLALLIPAVIIPPPARPGVIHAEESAYSHLEVVDYGNIVGLRTESRSGTIYSAMPKDDSLPPFLLYDLFAVPAAAAGAENGLLLGLGAGTIPRIHEILNPGLRLESVELDAKIVAIGKRFFGLDQRTNIKEIHISDARPFLSKSRERYDIIEMDIFRETEIPFYLVSKEFFALARERLAAGGVFVMNIYDPTPEHRIERAVSNTAAAVFPVTNVVPAGSGSFLLVGSESELRLPPSATASDERLAGLIDYFALNVERVAFAPQAQVFTDDRAPIEMLIATLPGVLYNKEP